MSINAPLLPRPIILDDKSWRKGMSSRAKNGKGAKEAAFVFEEDAEHPGNDKGDLTVRDIQHKLLAYPLTPFLKPLGMEGEAKTTQ